jgi:hypothetical protein
MNDNNDDWKMIATDPRLGWSARGLMLWLVAATDPQVRIGKLISETERSSRPAKRDAVYATISELIDAGYIRRQQERLNDGRMGRVTYSIFIKPIPTENETSS